MLKQLKPFLLFLLLLVAILLASLVCAQDVLAQNTAVFPGAIPTPAQLGVAVNNAETMLLLGIGATDTTLAVSSTAGFKAGSFVTIDSEILAVCAIADGTHFTIGRSACPNADGRGTDTANGGGAAIAHLAGSTVAALFVASHINQLAAEVIAADVRAKQAVSVLDYGADPHDTADSTAAFQAAASTCKQVLVPNGRYVIAGTVHLCSSTEFIGMSRDTNTGTVIDAMKTNNPGPVFQYQTQVEEHDGIVFRDIALLLPKNGIQFNTRLDDYAASPTCPNTPCFQAQHSVQGAMFDNVLFLGTYNQGNLDPNAGTTVAPSIAEMAGDGVCLSLSLTFTSTIINSLFQNCGVGLWIDQNSDENEVRNTRFSSNGWHLMLRGGDTTVDHNAFLVNWRSGGIQLYSSLSHYSNHIARNTFEQDATAAWPAGEFITANGGYSDVIDENQFIDPAAEGALQLPSTCMLRLDPATGMEVTNNTFGQGNSQVPTKVCIGITNYNWNNQVDRIIWTGNTPPVYNPSFPMVRTRPFDPYVFGFDRSPNISGAALGTFPWALDAATQAWTIGAAQPDGFQWRFPLRDQKDRQFYAFFDGRQIGASVPMYIQYAENSSIQVTGCTNANPMVCTVPGHGIVGSGYAAFAPFMGTGQWAYLTWQPNFQVNVIDANTLQFPAVDSTSYGTFSGQVMNYRSVDLLYSANVTFSSTALNQVQILTNSIPASRLGNGTMYVNMSNREELIASAVFVPVDELAWPFAKNGANTDITSLHNPSIDNLTVGTLAAPAGSGNTIWASGVNLNGLNSILLNGSDFNFSNPDFYMGGNVGTPGTWDFFMHTRGTFGLTVDQSTSGGYAPVAIFSGTGAQFPSYVLGAGRPAVLNGYNAGPYTFNTSNNILMLRIDATDFTVTLPTGVLTTTAVASAINAATSGMATATVAAGTLFTGTDGAIQITTTSASGRSQVQILTPPANSAQTVLGLPTGLTAHGATHMLLSQDFALYAMVMMLDATPGTNPCADSGSGTGTGHLAVFKGYGFDCR